MCVLQLFYRTPMNGYFWHVTYTQRKKQQRKQTFILNVINPTTATFPLNSWFLTHFMPLVSFYTPWKHPKTRSFLVLWELLKETSSEKWVNWENKILPHLSIFVVITKIISWLFRYFKSSDDVLSMKNFNWQGQIVIHLLSTRLFWFGLQPASNYKFNTLPASLLYLYLLNETMAWNPLSLSWWRSLSYRIQSIDFFCKSMNWFLYDMDLRLA